MINNNTVCTCMSGRIVHEILFGMVVGGDNNICVTRVPCLTLLLPVDLAELLPREQRDSPWTHREVGAFTLTSRALCLFLGTRLARSHPSRDVDFSREASPRAEMRYWLYHTTPLCQVFATTATHTSSHQTWCTNLGCTRDNRCSMYWRRFESVLYSFTGVFCTLPEAGGD